MFYGKNKNTVRINVQRDIPSSSNNSELENESGNGKEKIIKAINSIDYNSEDDDIPLKQLFHFPKQKKVQLERKYPRKQAGLEKMR